MTDHDATEMQRVTTLERQVRWARLRLGGIAILLAAILVGAATKGSPQEITARKIAVVDEDGNELVVLDTGKGGSPRLALNNVEDSHELVFDGDSLSMIERKESDRKRAALRASLVVLDVNETVLALSNPEGETTAMAASVADSGSAEDVKTGGLMFRSPKGWAVGLKGRNTGKEMGLYVNAPVVGDKLLLEKH